VLEYRQVCRCRRHPSVESILAERVNLWKELGSLLVWRKIQRLEISCSWRIMAGRSNFHPSELMTW